MAEATQNSVEREIRELEKLLEEKKRTLVERGEKPDAKEVFREAFKEKYAEAFKPVTSSPSTPPAVSISPTAKARGTARAKAEEELQYLIRLSFEKGVRAAADVAKRENPWLLDELHDRLVDEYYQKLVQARQIEESA